MIIQSNIKFYNHEELKKVYDFIFTLKNESKLKRIYTLGEIEIHCRKFNDELMFILERGVSMKVRVYIEIPDGEYSIHDSVMVTAYANVGSDRLEGYSDRASTYETVYEDITIEEEELEQYIFDTYGDIDYEWHIDEDTLEVE